MARVYSQVYIPAVPAGWRVHLGMAGYPLVDGQVHLVTVLYVHHFRGHTRRPHDGEGLRYFGTACRHLAYRTLLLV